MNCQRENSRQRKKSLRITILCFFFLICTDRMLFNVICQCKVPQGHELIYKLLKVSLNFQFKEFLQKGYFMYLCIYLTEFIGIWFVGWWGPLTRFRGHGVDHSMHICKSWDYKLLICHSSCFIISLSVKASSPGGVAAHGAKTFVQFELRIQQR